MTTRYQINPYIKGVNGYGLQFAADCYTVTLTASTDTTLAVPGQQALGGISSTTNIRYIAQFTYTAAKDVFVADNATAAISAGNTFASSTSCLNPTAKIVQSGDTLHFFTAASSVNVCVEFFYLEEF